MTHFVVIEYDPAVEGDPKQIPWAVLLHGAVDVKNWQYVNQPVSQVDSLINGMNYCISSHDCENDYEALKLISEAANNNGDIPDEINLCELYEHFTSAADLMDNIQAYAIDTLGVYTPLIKPGLNLGEIS